MGNPITWQNVTGPAMGNPAQFMQMATQGVDGAFDKLGAVLKQREEVDKANWDVGKANNTQAFLDQMSQYRTPAEFQAAQQSGALDASRQGFGAQIDRGAVRNAENGQLAKLQQGVTAGITYNNTVVADREAADRDAAGVRIAVGDTAGAQPFIDRLTRGKAPLVAEGQKQLLDRVVQQRADAKAGWDAAEAERKAQMFPGAVDLQKAQVAEVNARAANIPQETAIRQTEINARNLDRLNTIAADTAEKLSKTGSGAIGSKGAMDGLITNLGKVVENKDTVGKVSRQLNAALLSNPEFGNLPASVVESIALKQTGNVTDWFGADRTAAMKADLAEALKTQGTTMSAAAASKANLSSLLQQQRLSVDEAQRQVFPDLAKRIDEAKAKAGSAKSTEIANPFEDAEATNLVKQSVGTKTEVSVEQLPTAKPLMEQQASIEKNEINLGILKKHTPEVQKYLDDRKAGDKKENAAQELKRELYNNGYTAVPMGMQYTNEDIQGPIDVAKRQRATFEKAVEAAKRDR